MTKQLCKKCGKLYEIKTYDYYRRDIIRQIDCPECVNKLPGKELSKFFAERK